MKARAEGRRCNMPTKKPNAKVTKAEADKLRKAALDHLWIPMRQYNDVVEEGGPTIIVDGDGVRVKDINGKSYIDGLGGLFLIQVGHGRKEIADAVFEQLSSVHYANTFAYATIPVIRLAERIVSLAPKGMQRVFFASGGSEAVETAMKMSRQFHINNGQPQRTKFIARRGSYHGQSMGALSLNGSPGVHRERYEPMLPNVKHVGNIYCYRCPWGLEYPSCELNCAQDVERAIQFEGPETVAAVIAEPVSVSSGVSVPVKEYWPKLREICDKYGVLLIADEVITGFGRTGKMFAVEHWKVTPDIMTFAKGVTSGYQPVGGTIASNKVADAFNGGPEKTFTHGFTYSGHPAGAAAGLANLDIMERENLVQNSAKVGKYMLDSLMTLKEHSLVGDVRGLGLLCAVELVKNKTTKEKFPPGDPLAKSITKKLAEEGLLVRFDGVLFLSPPLTITKSEVDEIVTIVEKAVSWGEKQMGVK